MATDVLVTSNEQPVIAGYTSSQGAGGYDGLLAKLDETGNELWEHTYGGSEWDLFHAIAGINEGFVMAGSSSSFNSDAIPQAWLIRVDANGEVQWSITIDTLPDAVIRDVVFDGTDRIIVVGTSHVGTSNEQLLVACCTVSGEWNWVRELGGSGPEFGYGAVIQPNGTVMAVGYTKSFADHRQMFLGLIEQDGTVLSASAVSTAGDDWEARSIAPKPDGNYVMAAYTLEYGAGEKDYYLMTSDPLGNIESGPTFGGGGDDEPWGVSATLDGAFYIVGTTASYGPGASAVFLVRCVGDTLNGTVETYFDTVGLDDLVDSWGNRLSPNPASPGTVVSVCSLAQQFGDQISITDSFGCQVAVKTLNSSEFLVPTVASGCYIVSIGSIARYRLMIE